MSIIKKPLRQALDLLPRRDPGRRADDPNVRQKLFPYSLSNVDAARERAFTLSRVPQAEHVVLVLGHSEPGEAPSVSMRRRLGIALAELERDPAAVALVTGD